MKETVITWTVANWITVFLMFIGAASLIGLLFKGFTKFKAGKRGSN